LDTLTEIKAEGKQLVSTNCGHIFCEICLKDTIKSIGRKCPTCRKKLTGKNYCRPVFL